MSSAWDCERQGHTHIEVTSRRFRDLFRLRRWIVCWDCDLKIELPK
jgi:hypothetical protein